MPTIRQKLSTYAITLCTSERRRLFQRSANAELFIATLFRYRDAGKFNVHAFVIMPDHVHVLLTPAIDQSTSRCIQLLKGGYSHAARDQSRGDIWQPGHHEHRIRDEEDLRNQMLYIENNPARKSYAEYPYVHTAAAYAAMLDEAHLSG